MLSGAICSTGDELGSLTEADDMVSARIGIFLCHCGSNIKGVVDIDRLLEGVKDIADVEHVEDYKYVCSKPGQQILKDRVKEYRLNRIVIASCSPRMHEPTFRTVMREAGLNPYLLEIANIREHVSWVHSDDSDAATEKAIDLVRMSVARARLLEPLEETEVTVRKSTMVVGAGIAGISAQSEAIWLDGTRHFLHWTVPLAS
jgi:heterodisulfide reductase subunit A